MITHVIPTTEFVRLLQKKCNVDINFSAVDFKLLVCNYANFISQKPTEENCKLYFKNITEDLTEYVIKYNSFDVIIYKVPKLELTETALKQIGI
jgi:hypothetical protein